MKTLAAFFLGVALTLGAIGIGIEWMSLQLQAKQDQQISDTIPLHGSPPAEQIISPNGDYIPPKE